MPAIFVHLSDIHFGQERDERVHIHSDVKEQLIKDAADVVRALNGGVAHGVLVTGDIAQGGKHEQYEEAGQWLDTLAKSIDCPIFRIQMVPGNHDLDRDKLSVGAGLLLNAIGSGGQAEYEKILSCETDRASLFARFESYGRFCEGYDCALDTEGKFATNLYVELAPGRSIRFVRINSALLCTGDETEHEPKLMVGARQFVIPRKEGEEIVVLIHHPLNWFKDSENARTYLRSRARVLISGHEHNPKVEVDRVEEGSDLMMVAAGATVPFKSDVTYTYAYNVIEFDWDAEKDALAVTIHPRTWNPKRTCFEPDKKPLGGNNSRFVLGSPNFRKCSQATTEFVDARGGESILEVEAAPLVEMVSTTDLEEMTVAQPEIEGYGLVLLHFFRDLSEGERLRILIELDAIPIDSDERITQAVERQLFDWLVRQGRISEIEKLIGELLSNKKGREA